jgi:hypothetical protein
MMSDCDRQRLDGASTIFEHSERRSRTRASFGIWPPNFRSGFPSEKAFAKVRANKWAGPDRHSHLLTIPRTSVRAEALARRDRDFRTPQSEIHNPGGLPAQSTSRPSR